MVCVMPWVPDPNDFPKVSDLKKLVVGIISARRRMKRRYRVNSSMTLDKPVEISSRAVL